MKTIVVLVPTRNQSWNVRSMARLVTSKGIAVVVKRTTQMLVVRERGLRTNPKTKVDAIAWRIDSGATTHVCKDCSPYTPQQNGVAERKNRALNEMVNSILSYSGLSEGFWGEAMLTACYLLNRVPNKRNKTTPYELWFYVIEPNDSVSINLIIKSRDVIFDENRFSSIPRPNDIIPNVQESQMDDHTNDVPNEILEPRKGCKWIFKRKMKVDGTIDKFKARLVIQGFRQKEGIDYFDTYALVARITTNRLLLALVVIHNLVIHQMDVKTTFLNGDLDEEVYVKQPEGFVMPGNERKVCKLVKSLYGLKQAPKQ
ncbi:zinc finger, CCHC-type containing protein [Tanacetum coccineum]